MYRSNLEGSKKRTQANQTITCYNAECIKEGEKEEMNNVYPNDNPEEAAKKITQGVVNKKDKDEKPLPEHLTYKYSRPFLHEAIIFGALPSFIAYDPKADKIFHFDNLKEPGRILRPPNREDYPYTPYGFADELELADYLRRAKSETIDTLYQKAKTVVKKYTDQDEYKVNLLAIDIVWSYFQDKFGSTHYIIVTGANEGGKTSIGDTFGSIAYRTCNMTNPTAANIFRMLGMIEAGQCTLTLDEAERISEDTDILAILKSGYSNKKTSKTNTNIWKLEWFYAYCLKIIIAERSPDKLEAKGLLDRSLHVASFPGDTELDIKEVTNEEEKAPRLKRALAELIDLRKLMLVYRLVHFEDTIPDLDVGVRRRAKELCKPYIRLFYGSESQQEVEQTFQRFLEARNTKKSISLEPILLPVILELIEDKGTKVPSSEVWDYILEHSMAKPSPNPDRPGGYYLADYTIYRNTITKLLEDMFGAHSKHAEGGNETVFDKDKLKKLKKFYDVQILIKTRLIKEEEEVSGKAEGNEGSEGIMGNAPPSNDGKSIVDFDNGNGKNEDILRNRGLEGPQVPPALSQELLDESRSKINSPLFSSQYLKSNLSLTGLKNLAKDFFVLGKSRWPSLWERISLMHLYL